MLAELVFSLWQGGMPRRRVIQAFVNVGLQMLCPEPHRKRLAHQRKLQPVQHGENISGTVSHRQNEPLTGDVPRGGGDAGERAVPGVHPGEGGVKMHLTAQTLDLLPDGGDDTPQQVGAHMGLLPPGDVLRRAVAQQRPGDKGAQRVPHASGELAVREGTRAPLAKLDVGVFVQFTGGLKPLHRLHTAGQRRSPFQHDGTVPVAGQQQRRKQSRRAKPHHHRAVGQRRFAHRKGKFRLAGETDTGRGPGQSRFLTLVLERDGGGDDQHGRAVPGIHRELCDAAVRRLVRRHTQDAQGLTLRFRLHILAGERYAQITD